VATPEIRETVARLYVAQLREAGRERPPAPADGDVLLDSGLDSLGFAVLVTRLEDELGYDPFTAAPEPYYPQTFGDFVRFYQRHAPGS